MTIQRNRIFKYCSIIAAVFIMLSSLAYGFSVPRRGVGPDIIHDTPVTENTVRISLVDMESFFVIRTGDRRNKTGELQFISVALERSISPSSTGFERHTSRVNAPFLDNLRSGKTGNNAYINIQPDDEVRFSSRSTDSALDPVWVNAEIGDRLVFTLSFRDLDCLRTRICARGNRGNYTIVMTVPEFPRGLSATCEDRNRFNWVLLDNEWQFRQFNASRISDNGSPLLIPHSGGALCVTPAL